MVFFDAKCSRPDEIVRSSPCVVHSLSFLNRLFTRRRTLLSLYLEHARLGLERNVSDRHGSSARGSGVKEERNETEKALRKLADDNRSFKRDPSQTSRKPSPSFQMALKTDSA